MNHPVWLAPHCARRSPHRVLVFLATFFICWANFSTPALAQNRRRNASPTANKPSSQHASHKRPTSKAATNQKRDRTRKAEAERNLTNEYERGRERLREGRPAYHASENVGKDEAEEEKEEDLAARQDWFIYQRTYPSGKIPTAARSRAWDVARPTPTFATRQTDATTPQVAPPSLWQPLGPLGTNSYFPSNWGRTSGRINAVAIAPNDANLVLIGAATGGLWRSVDGGATFAPVSDNQADLAVGALAFAPSAPNIVYAAMGDIYNNYIGSGVLKSSDAGATWTRISGPTLPEAGFNMRIAVDATNPQRVYLAQATYNPRTGGSNSNSGIYLSTDGGVTWTLVLAGNARDVATHPANSNIIYAALRTVTGNSAGLYRSTDKGLTWTLLRASVPASPADARLAVTPADPNRIYFYTGSPLTVQTSADGGTTWTVFSSTGIDPSAFGYNTYIAADPANAQTVYVGARDVFRSTDGGATWANITRNFTGSSFSYNPYQSNTHPDQHAIAFGADGAIYLGNDGGLSKSVDGGASFFSCNATLGLTQAIGVSLHPTNDAIAYIGTQDNGTQRRMGGTEWREFNTGDGGYNVIPKFSSSKVLATYVRGTIDRFGNYGATFERTVATDSTFGGSRIAFYAPMVGNGVNDRIYFGTYRLHISDNLGETWYMPAPATDLTKGGSDVLNALAVAPSDANIIYTGSRNGRVMRSDDGGTTWADITLGLPNRTVTSVTVSPQNAATAWVTVSGFATGHVFQTTDKGVTWLDVSGNLPNVPANTFLVDPRNPSAVYVGTDVGIFHATMGGNYWSNLNYGLPPAPVIKLAANLNGTVLAATYGRGVFQAVNNFDDAAFVRAHYADFLNRAPDAGGFNYWLNEIAVCGTNAACRLQKRVTVSAAFFVEQEFQQTGAFVYRLSRAAYGTRPAFADFLQDHAQILTGNDLAANKRALAAAFTNRAAFVTRYPVTQTGAQFVDALLTTVQQSTGVDLSAQRATLLTDYATGGRGLVLHNVTENAALAQAEYYRAFVLMQYFGYLRREPDTAGYDFWLDVITHREPGNVRGMVCAFITSAEYQRRFGLTIAYTNAACAP